MGDTTVFVEKGDDGLATIALDRPEARNALNPTEDHVEGVRAFLENQRPRFAGR